MILEFTTKYNKQKMEGSQGICSRDVMNVKALIGVFVNE